MNRRFRDYLERTKAILYAILDVALIEHAQFIVVAGDFLDNQDLLPAERDLLVQWLIDLDQAGIHLIAISGNHDQLSARPGHTNLTWLRILAENKRLKAIIEDRKPIIVQAYGWEWGLIPGWHLKGEEFHFIADLLLSRRKTDKVIMVVHSTFRGAVFDNDFEAPDDLPELEPKEGVLYWALGDVHVPQVSKVLDNAAYSGASAQFKFGDSPDKGVLVVDTDEPTAPRFVKLKGIKKFVTLRGIEAIKNAPANAYCKAVLDEDSPELDLSGFDVVDREVEVGSIGRRLTHDPLDGLEEFLRAKGIKKRNLLKLARKEALKIKREAGY